MPRSCSFLRATRSSATDVGNFWASAKNPEMVRQNDVGGDMGRTGQYPSLGLREAENQMEA